MTNKDARVAEIIGENVRQLKSGEWQYEVKDKLFTTWYPVLPYITNPNYALDGIVKDFVRDNWKGRQQSKFNDAFNNIVNKRLGIINNVTESYVHLLSYPGDYANALLEVNDNE